MALALSQSEEEQNLHKDLSWSMANCSTNDAAQIICNRCSVVFEWFEDLITVNNCNSCKKIFCEECILMVADRNGYENIIVCEQCHNKNTSERKSPIKVWRNFTASENGIHIASGAA